MEWRGCAPREGQTASFGQDGKIARTWIRFVLGQKYCIAQVISQLNTGVLAPSHNTKVIIASGDHTCHKTILKHPGLPSPAAWRLGLSPGCCVGPRRMQRRHMRLLRHKPNYDAVHRACLPPHIFFSTRSGSSGRTGGPRTNPAATVVPVPGRVIDARIYLCRRRTAHNFLEDIIIAVRRGSFEWKPDEVRKEDGRELPDMMPAPEGEGVMEKWT